MIFDDCVVRFVECACAQIPTPVLGPFLLKSFEKALQGPCTPFVQREVQALGREALQRHLPQLLASPELLTPLGAMFADKRTEGLDKVRPRKLRCLSVTLVGRAFVTTFHDMFFPEKRLEEDFVIPISHAMRGYPEFGRFARQLAAMVGEPVKKGSITSREARTLLNLDSNPEADALGAELDRLIEETRNHPADEAKPPTTPVNPPKISEADVEDILRCLEDRALPVEAPKEPVSLLDVMRPKDLPPAPPEDPEKYKYVTTLQPAFIDLMNHPYHGWLLLMAQVSGINPRQEMVFRGGALHDPRSNRMVVHKELDSVIGPFSWEDPLGGNCNVKAVKFQRGLCGKFWTNVKSAAFTGDIYDLKRWFKLTVHPVTQEPMILIWSGTEGEKAFTAYFESARRQIRHKQARDEARRTGHVVEASRRHLHI